MLAGVGAFYTQGEEMNDKLPSGIPACAVNMLARPEWFADPEIVTRVRLTEASRIAHFISSKRFAGTGVSAITLGRTIHMRKPERYDPHSAKGLALLAHEIKHVEQYEQAGRIRFYARYLWDYVRYRYRGVSFEEEAYAFQEVVKEHLLEEFEANPGLSPCQEQADPHTPNDAFVKTTPPVFVP
jgi:hypothetical protein